MEAPKLSIVPARSWLPAWLRTATVGTLLLAAIFGGYELVERLWLKDGLPLDLLFRLHVLRGLGSAVLMGSWAFFGVWSARRRYDLAFTAAYRDLEARHEARTQMLARAQAFTERLFDAIRDRLIVIDQNGRLVKANRVALEMADGPLLGLGCTMSVGAAGGERGGCVAARALREGKPLVGQIRTDMRTGRILAIDAYPVPDPESGHDVVIEVARDVTEAKQLEMRLRSQEKMAALGVLAAGIAHDIGNPLASMSSELQMLEAEEDIGRMRESIGVIQKHIGRISRTLRELNDFVGRRVVEPTRVPIKVAIEDALRMVLHDPRARRISISSEIAPDLPDVQMVEDRLVMVLVNLLINAFDAMPRGGRLTIRAWHDAEGQHVAIADTGVGMTPEVRQRALEPLFTTKPQGSGLGLTISAEAMLSVGGALELDSTQGVGTTVRLRFPVEAPPQSPPVSEVTHA